MRFSTALLPLAAAGLLAACDMPPPAPGATADAPAATQSGEVPMPAGLTSEERFIWGTLTPEAQAQAAEYIANGGTLTQFINA